MQERRSTQRIADGYEASLANLTSGGPVASAVVVDVSRDCASINTDLRVHSGDALAIRLPGLIVLAEAVRSQQDGGSFIVGAKLRHSLSEADVRRCAEQFAFDTATLVQ